MNNVEESAPQNNANLGPRLAEQGLELLKAAVGAGGSATVHQARVQKSDGKLPPPGTLVAVKQFKPELLAAEEQLRRVRQEADVGRTLKNPNLVRTYGLLPSSDAPEFLVMEWIDGANLAEWNRNVEAPDWATIRSIALGVVDGLTAIHAAGVHHRDIKPENVMVRRGGGAVIIGCWCRRT